MATARIDIRLDEDVKARAEKAVALLGLKSLTDYITKLMDENSAQVIAQHESIQVPNDIFDAFVLACEEAKAPNQALVEALNFTTKAGIK